MSDAEPVPNDAVGPDRWHASDGSRVRPIERHGLGHDRGRPSATGAGPGAALRASRPDARDHRPAHHQLALRRARRHWTYDRESRTFSLDAGRRPAGYVVATPGSKAFDDPGVFVELPLVNQIRPRVKAWREAGYPGVTGITKRLLEHWHDPGAARGAPLLLLPARSDRDADLADRGAGRRAAGHRDPGDGGPFPRLCAKMATGSGKTIVMAMVIAWQVLNKVDVPAGRALLEARVRRRAGPDGAGTAWRCWSPRTPGNYYDEFDIVPVGAARQAAPGQGAGPQLARAELGDARSRSPASASVDKRGAKSDEAYVREVLGEHGRRAEHLLVINDEAHHAWRVPAESQGARASRRRTSRRPRSGSAASTASTAPAASWLLRLLGDAVRARRARRAPRRRSSTGS